MITVNALLLVCAFICFLLSTFGVAARINLQSLGLAFWVLALLLTGFRVIH